MAFKFPLSQTHPHLHVHFLLRTNLYLIITWLPQVHSTLFEIDSTRSGMLLVCDCFRIRHSSRSHGDFMNFKSQTYSVQTLSEIFIGMVARTIASGSSFKLGRYKCSGGLSAGWTILKGSRCTSSLTKNLAEVSTRCSSHHRGKSEVCGSIGGFYSPHVWATLMGA